MSQYSDSTFNFDDTGGSWTKTFNLIPEKSLVMDIGCSSGNFGAELIAKKYCIVDGIEVDDSDIAKAKKKLRKVYKANIEMDSLPTNEKYDVVFMGDVIEHLARPIDALKRVKKLLKPNGVLVFSIPNITHMSVRLMLLKGEIVYGKTGLLDETHLHFFNREEIYRVLNASGFEVTTFQYVPRDIPTDVLREELASIGLLTTKKFEKLAHSLNAAAYQFIGTAIMGPVAIQKLPKKSPITNNDVFIKKWRKQYIDSYKQLEEKYTALKKERDKLKEEITFVKTSKVWKMAQYIKKQKTGKNTRQSNK